MATTVDHLAPGLRVRVLRDFTDLRGRSVAAGERGVIHALGLDLATMEITFDWARGDVREVLRFPARRTDGPSNGHMRDFFEVEPEVIVAVPAAHAETAEPSQASRAWSPARPELSLAPLKGRQPSTETNLHELRVACDCDWRLHRPVLDLVCEPVVQACMSCGTVTATRSIGDDGRFTGDAWQHNLVVALPDDVHAWIAAWPRAVPLPPAPLRWPTAHGLQRVEPCYLPATARCGTAAELEALEAGASRAQARQDAVQRLRAAGVPSAAPPRALPAGLAAFASLWRALRLGPDSPEDELLAHAQPGSPGSAVAAGVLRQRRGANEFMLAALRSDDPSRRSAGHAMALLQPQGDPQLAEAIVDILQALPLRRSPDVEDRVVGHGRIEALLVLIADRALATPAMIGTLVAMQRKVARIDASLVRAIRVVLAELRGDPPMSSVRPGFLP